nr:zinc finger, CCHC-type [Tanacetum cinerariifolium]
GGLVKARDFIHDIVIGNKFYQKKKLYAFYMSVGQKISKHIDEFSKIVLDLANIESGKFKVINGSRVILSGIRRDNRVYSLDGHAMAGELNASVEEKDTYGDVVGTSKNVVFNESVMYKDTLKDSGACVDKFVEELQTPDLTDYQLTRDREPRTRTKPLRFQDESNMVAYAFVTAEKEDTHEPLSYKEALTCKDSSKCKAAIKEDMDSLRKNKTWELVDHPAGQKLVSYKRLFKIKEWNEGAKKPRYKERLMAC